jgi:hypothetical protein
MMNEITRCLRIHLQILGVVSGNMDEEYGHPPGIKASAFQSSERPAQTAHLLNIYLEQFQFLSLKIARGINK